MMKERSCSYCGERESKNCGLVPHNDEYICDDCAYLLGWSIPKSSPCTADLELPKPKDLFERLSERVVGQDAAKRALCVAVCNHYKRLLHNASMDEGETKLSKSNVLLLGPTGCGKTLLAHSLAEALDVPFAIADATSLTAAGYVGDDVENILLRLINAANGDIERAQIGIVYLDEIDKLACKSENTSITRDVSGECVQQALLKIIEGTVARVPPNGGRKHPGEECLEIDTTNILFILGGAFPGLENIVAQRTDKRGIGFNAILDESGVECNGEILPDDLERFGLIPELVGRVPVIAVVKELSEDDLLRVLTEPRDSLVSQYQLIFDWDQGVRLTFKKEALRAIVREAIKRKTGARGLRAICERILRDAMFEVPSNPYVREVVVTEESVISGKSVIIRCRKRPENLAHKLDLCELASA